MIENIKYAIFDMDGTLINSLILWDIVWKEFGKHFLGVENFVPSIEDDKAVRTMTIVDAMSLIHNTYGMGSSVEELCRVCDDYVKNFYANEVELKDGVREFLDYCCENEIEMCIASATETRLLDVAIDHCDIRKYFTHVLSCADIGKGKNQPDIYLKAMECMGATKDNTYVFEDSLVAIDTAGKAGFKTVGIYDKFNYGQDEIKKIATIYIGEGETLEKLIR